MNNVIYYSNFNLDSQFAAMTIASSLKYFNKFQTLTSSKINEDTNTNVVKLHVKEVNEQVTEDTVQLISYDRTSFFKVPDNIDTVFIVGADVSPIHMGQLIEQNPKVDIRIANHSNSEKYNKTILKNISQTLNNGDNDHYFDNVSKLVFSMFSTENHFNDIFPSINKSDFINLMDSVVKYSNFELMSLEDTIFVYKNIPNIVNYLEEGIEFKIQLVDQGDSILYAKHVKDIRAIITRNFSLRYLVNGADWLNAPSMAVNQENAHAAIRLVNYSYENVLTYEDMANCRVYRILTKLNENWFIKCIKPIDVWHEGNLVFMKTQIPVHEAGR